MIGISQSINNGMIILSWESRARVIEVHIADSPIMARVSLQIHKVKDLRIYIFREETEDFI